MISKLLFYKIFQLFIFMLLGFILVKFKVVKSKDSRILSKLSLYLFMPSVIINSFDVALTDDIINGLIISFVVAIAIHIVLLMIDFVFKKALKLSNVERASVMYSNAGNLIIPIVAFLLGDQWLIYTCAFISVQILFLWTHGIFLFSKSEKFSIKKIICNVNIIAIIIGAVLLISKTQLPPLIKDVVSPLGGMLGTVGMIIAGMVAADINYKIIIKDIRMYMIVFLRLVICPLVMLALMYVFKKIDISGIDNILLISFLASITPPAATIMQFAQITNNNEEYAASINIVSTILCIATMPFFVWLFNII